MANYETDKWEIKEQIKAGGWKVAEGGELTETDVIQGVVAAGISIYTGNSAPFVAWLKALVTNCLSQLASNIQTQFTEAARQQAIAVAETTIRNLLSQKSSGAEFLNFGSIQFKAGVAKYMGRNRVWVPNLSLEGGYWQTLSTTHAWQPYVAMRFVSSSPGTTPGGSPPGQTNAQVIAGVKEFIADKWGQNYDITNLLYAGSRAAVVMTKTSAMNGQSYLLSDAYPGTFIKTKFEEGFRVTTLSCHAGHWAVVMSKGTPYSAQWRKFDTSIGDFIQAKHNEGNRITQLTYGDGKWSVVMMGDTGITAQYWQTSDAYPDAFISQKFQQGYRLTHLSCEGGQWAAVMSQGLNYTAQWRKASSAFPADFIAEKWNGGNRITSITYGDGLWGVVMLGNTGWGAQTYKYWG
jgi:hypothetical protein